MLGIGSALENAYRSTQDWMRNVGDSISQSSFEAWVAAEARTAAHLAMPVYEAAAGESINNLTSDMLRMYLNGTTPDANLIRKVGEEIGKSSTFARLAATAAAAIQADASALGRMLNSSELLASASRVINRNYRDPLSGKAMYFSNADRGLQGVIGGITGLSVSSVSVNGNSYVVDVAISDTYDFNNQQNTSNDPDLQTYVDFRNRLSSHIRARRYRSFLYDYHSALYTGNFDGRSIARSRVFAAFMVAIERNGLTPGGVSWTAIVPFRGTVSP